MSVAGNLQLESLDDMLEDREILERADSVFAIPRDRLPRHIGLVMDGNGRWAKQRGLPRTEGHRRGELALVKVVEACAELGIPYLTVYAFSTENWRRSPDEVKFLLGYNREVIRKRRDELHEKNVRVLWSGQRKRLWRSVISEIEAAERLTAHNTGLTFTLCVNYGGQAEIVAAAAALADKVAAGALKPADITEKLLAEHLNRPELPDVDLFLRTSGEQRLSNFLLWQSAYAELVFVDTLFPDFGREGLFDAVRTFAGRQRRYGSA